MRTSSSGPSGRGALLAGVALFALLAIFWETGPSPSSSSTERQLAGGKDGEPLPEYALFFPIIVLLIGVVFYYIIGRFLHHAFPYTAAMFIFGTIMGTVLERLPENQVTTSFNMWASIDGHLLILGFLPGLLFRDAYCQNIHLFRKAFAQCSIMAFPEVLAGTALTACVLTYVFPYFKALGMFETGQVGEAFIFSMVLGSILSATDPVAVSALLNEVGAPPRLKTHIAGESLLNDGAAVVFFNIFYKMDVYNFTGGLRGQNFTWGSGIAYFVKLSLGSAALGIAFGLLLVLCLWALKQRYNHEENIVQVMTTLAFAYLSFYCSEAMLGMSGIITVVFCGVLCKSFTSTINDQVAMEKFWELLEHILNTVLFAVGGLVWGTVIVNARYEAGYPFKITGRDWGYLFLLYFFLLLIRTILVFGFYPIISRIGLKSSWQEAAFMSWGGLRGAVGIALGILVENAWKNVTEEDVESFVQNGGMTEKDMANANDSGFSAASWALFGARYVAHLWFFFAGGIAFLTLFINGSTAGPLLKKLGLAAPTAIRKSITKRFRHSISLHAIENLLKLLSSDLFGTVDFADVRTHVPDLKDITYGDVVTALKRVQASQDLHEEFDLSTFEPFFTASEFEEIKEVASNAVNSKPLTDVLGREVSRQGEQEASENELIEVRKVFLSLLESANQSLIEKGFIEARDGDFLVYNLTSCLERAKDLVARGEPLKDWELSGNSGRILYQEVAKHVQQAGRRTSLVLQKKPMLKSDASKYKKTASIVNHAVACISAHELVQQAFKEEFADDRSLSPAERTVIEESNAQAQLAKEALESMDFTDVCCVKARLLCNILLNQMVHDAQEYHERGLLLQTEAEHIIHDLEYEIAKLGKSDIGNSEKRASVLAGTDSD